MASILQVEQIQGPTSGASANTITIPSGQTIDMSNATVNGALTEMPSGSIVQVQNTVSNIGSASNGGSNTFTNSGLIVNITPKFADSIMIIHAQGHVYRNGAGHNWLRVINHTSGQASGNRGHRDTGGPYHESTPIVWKETPGNTNQQVYEIQFADRDNAGSQTLYFNDGGGYQSGMTVFEVRP